MVLSQVWIILSTTPVLMGDILVVLLFFWCEMCVISHYQNLRDGVDELELAGASGMTLMTAPGHHHSGPMFGGIGANQRRPEAFWSSVMMMSGRYHGQPVPKHQALAGVTPAHFARWLDAVGSRGAVRRGKAVGEELRNRPQSAEEKAEANLLHSNAALPG